ncbi:hypothetical protein RRG08_050284 [Elysia crispata]|uniref:Uncharacterized protein n=1 Tax=Elysia crispata TaxID=231223 RepID=A0AAE1B3E4_9GAST|nr:hypothetical protein RRG08_050284 [Elysia crispata]
MKREYDKVLYLGQHMEALAKEEVGISDVRLRKGKKTKISTSGILWSEDAKKVWHKAGAHLILVVKQMPCLRSVMMSRH